MHASGHRCNLRDGIITQDAEILAVFAITGGFSTPVLLSTGVNREIALFSYVFLLDLGILALVVFRPWRGSCGLDSPEHCCCTWDGIASFTIAASSN